MRFFEAPGRWTRSLLGACLLLLLSACGPGETPTPTRAPIPIVHVSPSAGPFAYALGQAYLRDQGPLPFDLVAMGSEDARRHVERGRATLVIDLPPVPEDWFVTPLGHDALTFIVHEGIGLRDLDFDQLRALFTGRIENWDELSETDEAVALIVPPEGDPLRTRFETAVMDEQPVHSGALLAPTPARAAQMAAQNPGSIGLLPLSAGLPEGVRRVRVEGELPSAEAVRDRSYPLTYDVLAMAPSEPSGAVREWLIWVQASQTVVAQP